MEKLEFKVTDSLNRWHVTPVKREGYDSPYKAFDAEMNPGEGYVQIVYPVRENFLQSKKIDDVKYYSGDYDIVYFPFENGRVEYTTFIHTPHYLSFYAQTYILVEENIDLPFEIFTCGGVRIWVNGEEVDTFTPYTRNITSNKKITLSLNKGENEIVVYADELAERDVFFYFELRYSGDEAIDAFLQVEEPIEQIKNAETFLESCFFEKDIYDEGEVQLSFEKNILLDDIEIFIESEGMHTGSTDTGNVKKVVVKRNDSSCLIGSVELFQATTHEINLSIFVGKYKITRILFVAVSYKRIFSVNNFNSVEERKMEVLSIIAKYGESGVQNALAILHTEKEMTDCAWASLKQTILKIEKKEDCADFHLGSLLLLLDRYSEYLTDELKIRIKASLINFRYWIDEPGNDVMWFFSENHALLFHIGQYLTGNYFPDDLFTASQRTGREQYDVGKQRLYEWFDMFFKYGYAEWNSTTYLPIDLIGFFTLYEIAPDEDIKELAKKALDFTFKIISYNTFNGIMSSSVGRTYEHTIKGRELNEVNMLSYITDNVGRINSRTSAATLYAISSYVPEKYSDNVLVKPGEEMTLEYMQGEEKVQTYLYKTIDYQMGSVVDFKAFKHGHQQHLSIVSLGETSALFYINHPGERPFSGGGRPSYWAGNGTNPLVNQYKNITLMLTNIDDSEIVKYIHAYSPLYDYDQYSQRDKWFFSSVGSAYLGVYFANGYDVTKNGANTGKELISWGIKNGIILKAGSKQESGSFDTFIKKCTSSIVIYSQERGLTYVDSQYGEINMAYDKTFTVKGEEIERVRSYDLNPEIRSISNE